MNIFDLDKNSLPEQVQINKENIATLMTDPTTKQYVDDQDAIVLQDAKDYADTKDALKQDKLTTSSVNDGTIEKNIGFDTDGNLVKQTPSTTITAADVDSETATAGQVLAADGNGGASWQNASSGGITFTLLWSGSAVGNTGVSVSSLADSLSNYPAVLVRVHVNANANADVFIKLDSSNLGTSRFMGYYYSGGTVEQAGASMDISASTIKVLYSYKLSLSNWRGTYRFVYIHF